MEVGRLAPSPTGAQHLGNARTFLVAWASIRQKNGHLLLRIEDIDSPRIKNWAKDQALEDLLWLGLDWDEGPVLPSSSNLVPRGEHQKPFIETTGYVQSERLDRYQAILTELKGKAAVYPCICTRSDVEQSASAPHEISDGPVYGRTCYHLKVQDSQTLNQPFAWRFRTEDRVISFLDGIHGQQKANVSCELGDFVVYKNDNSPAYQLAVVVDDHDMKITEVVRGDDLIPSTFRQIALYEHLGWTPPRFIHVPLVVGTDGRRLAKRHGDTRLSHYREQGIRPERILGLLGYSLGWLATPAEISAAELIPLANLESIPRNPWVLDSSELNWLES